MPGMPSIPKTAEQVLYYLLGHGTRLDDAVNELAQLGAILRHESVEGLRIPSLNAGDSDGIVVWMVRLRYLPFGHGGCWRSRTGASLLTPELVTIDCATPRIPEYESPKREGLGQKQHRGKRSPR